MSKLSLTRAQIINQGLAIAGRPDLISDGRLWLNMFLEEFYYAQDVDWLVKSLTGQAVTQGGSIPSDYRALKSAVLWYNGSPVSLLQITNPAEYDAKRISIGQSAGCPTHIYVDQDERKFYFLPAPNAGTMSLDLKYYYIPTIPTHADSSGDSETVKWDMPSYILVDFIKAAAMEYNDDERQENMRNLVLSKIAQAKMNNRDSRAGHTRIQMGERFKKRRFK